MEKLKVNKEACISCGACVSMYSDIFKFGADDKAEVQLDNIPEDSKEDAIEAIEGCPTGAIEFVEEKKVA